MSRNLIKLREVGDQRRGADGVCVKTVKSLQEGKYELRPKVSASRVSFASRVVNPKHDELRPAKSKELYRLHRKLWVYKMSNNWKVLTKFYCALLYTQLYAHIQNC